MSGRAAPAVSLFTEFLEDFFQIDDVRDIEPAEIKQLCEDPIFQRVCDYCYRSRHRVDHDDSAFDRDELGLDPETDQEVH